MGREQGDHLGEIETVWYVGKVNGVEHERPASTPAEHINLRARGWVTKESLGRENASEGTSTLQTSPSGSSAESTQGSSEASSPSASTTDQQTSGTGPATARRGGKQVPDVQSAAPQDGVAAGTE